MTGDRFKRIFALALACALLSACRPAENLAVVTATSRARVTPSPTIGTPVSPSLDAPPGIAPTQGGASTTLLLERSVTCADLDQVWGDWPGTIEVLNQLIEDGQSCGVESLTSKLYAAHFNFASTLESAGNIPGAVEHYRAALSVDARRIDALKALARLSALPTPTPSPCGPVDPDLAGPETSEPVDPLQMVQLSGGQLVLADAPYLIRGVNYYPRHAPWERFLPQADPAEMARELDLVESAGFNTIRVFLWNQPLFVCDGGQTVPDKAMFGKVDQLLTMAWERDIRVIVTLNDLPDLFFSPLYDATARDDAATAYIVRRYRSSPAILAWDLRNEGDLDYLPRHGEEPRFTEEQVIAWLGHVSAIVRENDPNHLVTAGWWGDPVATEPYVDFLSFHHWNKADVLTARIAAYREKSDMPMLLQEFGYAHRGVDDPDGQAVLLGDVAREAEAQGLLGWIVWTAFDYEPPPGQEANYESFFGLWTLDLIPKAALAELPLN